MAAPEAMRGRVASLTMLYPAMISAGAFLAGPLSDLVGVRNASAGLAMASILAIITLYVVSPQIREMRTR
jgi:MFS family permease